MLQVSVATNEDLGPIAQMLELYQHDLVDIWDQDLDCLGRYGYDIAPYVQPSRSSGFLFRVGGLHAGFALVDAPGRFCEGEWWMAQFFVVRKYRRRGVGRAAARQVLDAVRGRWEVGQMAANRAGREFWRSVVGEYTHGAYVEHWLETTGWHGSLQCFDNGHLGPSLQVTAAVGRNVPTAQTPDPPPSD